jgi:hypothetical protein
VGWPQDAAGELPQKDQASRASEARRARVLCVSRAATVRTSSEVAEGVSNSTLDASFWCAPRVVGTCARACARANFGSAPRVRTASQRITLRRTFDCLNREGSAGAMAPACGAILADHEHVCVILACPRRVEGCREAHVQSFGAHHRVLGTCGDAGTCLGVYLEIICRGRTIIPRVDLDTFTPTNREFTVA